MIWNMLILVQYIRKITNEEGNYRPVSILSNLSKIYEKLMYNWLIILTIYYFQVNVASGKGIVLIIVF